jgi:hypothetical protein
MMDATSQAYTQIPCCGCNDYRRDKILTRLAMFWLACERGEQPKVPTRAELLRGCCKSAELGLEQDQGITILVNPPSQAGPPKPMFKREPWW